MIQKQKITILLLLALLSGCSTYRDDFQYTPRPDGFLITSPPATAAQPLELQVSIIGVRTDHPKEHPNTIEVRIRIENHTPALAIFIPESMQLIASDLGVFERPEVDPAEGVRIKPGDDAKVTAYFPLITRDSQRRSGPLAGLNLRWTMKVGDQPVTCSSNFTRRPYYDGPYGNPYYYDSWWGPRVGVGVGFHSHHR